MLQIWEDCNHLCEGRLDNKVNETDLALRNISCLSVEELTDREAMHLLKVSLREEFNKEKVAPKTTQFPWFCWIGNVCQVEHKLDQQFFVLGLLWIEFFVHDPAAQVAQLNEVLGHVRGKDSLDDYVSDALEAVSIHVDGPVTRLLFTLGHQGKRLCQMVVLKH